MDNLQRIMLLNGLLVILVASISGFMLLFQLGRFRSLARIYHRNISIWYIARLGTSSYWRAFEWGAGYASRTFITTSSIIRD
jgi:hypothetical protein